ncbi:class II aldolase/adducin family protein [Parvularcula sp. LCG005]|uniref:class II aldolase/adducin family protein n=1 Tax=Parvularcula sp. LCG005 TaxID=3078805 RepID=UPI002941E4C0|nr:class II aldolase/adducin family protein [Parvularcula sp. LCG005]WOI54138.1 class II aldolase/adducin family protein [Parvularcula sp. LCG005]
MDGSTTATSQPAMSTGLTGPALDPRDLPSLKGQVSDEEWRIRCELAATYRLAALFGWDDLIFTHISHRLPDEDGEPRFLINPYGLLFEEITASSLLKINMDGHKITDSPYAANPAGFTIHSAVHAARHDAICVLHLHTPYGVAVSVQEDGLKRYTQFALVVHDDLAYHGYEGIALNLDERERLIEDLGEKNCMLLRNHGTLTLGANCGIAFARMYFLERACETQILAQADKRKRLTQENAKMAALVASQAAPGFVPGIGDRLLWPGLLRRLARNNPGWDQ